VLAAFSTLTNTAGQATRTASDLQKVSSQKPPKVFLETLQEQW